MLKFAAFAAVLALAGPVLADTPPAAPAAAAPPPPAGCTSPQSRQMDFWVGRWDVYRTSDPAHKVANSLIENLYLGCAIRENWAPLRGGAGGSLSSYVPGDPGWRQTWVDSDGATTEYRGAWDGHSMVMTAPDSQQAGRTNRMTYTPNADGSVRQHGETSEDGGHTWTPDYDFTYRRAAAGA